MYSRNRLGGGGRIKKKVLTLSVSKQWYNLIKAGVKTEEYREIKQYWRKRLLYSFEENIEGRVAFGVKFKPFTHVTSINGYGNDKPRIEKEIESISIGKPKKGWCPDEFLDKEYFVIKLK